MVCLFVAVCVSCAAKNAFTIGEHGEYFSKPPRFKLVMLMMTLSVLGTSRQLMGRDKCHRLAPDLCSYCTWRRFSLCTENSLWQRHVFKISYLKNLCFQWKYSLMSRECGTQLMVFTAPSWKKKKNRKQLQKAWQNKNKGGGNVPKECMVKDNASIPSIAKILIAQLIAYLLNGN